MDSQMKKKRSTLNIPKTPNNTSNDDTTEESRDDEHCNIPCCFFCIMKEQDTTLRRGRIATCFKEMPHRRRDNDEEHVVLMLSELWHIAMNQPNDPEFPSLGIFNCMAKLIHEGINNTNWLLTNQNIYIPYYAAHIIGSYTINKEEFAQIAVQSGVIPPLLKLLSGKISWVEQRVAVRALGHLASYNGTFESVAEFEQEVVKSAMNLASTCLELVYAEYFLSDANTRMEYHSNLLTRGVGGLEMENRKVEEWASQLQCWSLYLLNCFASKHRSLNLICKKVFLNDLCDMWGGLVNHTSPGGVGLIRILCYSKAGRKSIADLPKVINSLCNLSRSCDDWQYIGIDCLVLLLRDPLTRYKVIDIAASYLVDLVELRSLGDKSNVGDTITKVLLLEQVFGEALQEVVDLKIGRRINKQKVMSEEKLEETRVIALSMKKKAKKMLMLGNIEEALLKYSEAVDVCPLRFRRERMKLYSNKAMCHLLLKDPDSAISDSTRALCLSNPANKHGKSLWRRAQAYDMKGMGKESLMDCIMYINCCIKVPYHAMRMICKQMDATWIFASARSKSKVTNNIHQLVEKSREVERNQNVQGNQDKMMMRKTSTVPGLSTIIEEPFEAKEAGRRKIERASRGLKKVVVSTQV